MNLSDIARLRMINQQMAGTKITTGSAMVQWFGGVQGQEYAQTKWGLGMRLKNSSDEDIEKDFTSGKILRTHVLRPTWHFVSEKDIRWLLALTSPRVHQANAYMYRQSELDSKVFTKCHRIISDVLEGGKQLTREEINSAFAEKKIVAAGHRLSYIMMHAELEGIICSGARRGNQFTYALLDERVKFKNSIDMEEALRELTLRYFTSRGPATIKDFSTWSGLTTKDCKKAIDMIQRDVEGVTIDDNEYFFTPISGSRSSKLNDIHLLPIYDELIMGYKERDAYFQFRNNLKSSVKLAHDNMIVKDGQIIGTWGRSVKSSSIEISTQFFKPLNKTEKKALESVADRLKEFTGASVVILPQVE